MTLFDDFDDKPILSEKLFSIGDVLNKPILIMPTSEGTIETRPDKSSSETRNSDVTYCDVIVAELDPPVLYKRVAVFWTTVRKQLAPKMGKWSAGIIRQGDKSDKTRNQKEYWIQSVPKTAAMQHLLTQALNNHVTYVPPNQQEFQNAEEEF